MVRRRMNSEKRVTTKVKDFTSKSLMLDVEKDWRKFLKGLRMDFNGGITQ